MSCNVTADPDVLRDYYPELRSKVHQYLVEGHISEVIRYSYSRLLVDEYQDCNLDQHEIISTLSEALPTVIFGDPLQCIFNFAGPMPSWNGVVQSAFPLICKLISHGDGLTPALENLVTGYCIAETNLCKGWLLILEAVLNMSNGTILVVLQEKIIKLRYSRNIKLERMTLVIRYW